MIRKLFSKRPFLTVSLCTSIAVLGACGLTTPAPYMRGELANRLASPAWMVKTDVRAGDFNLRTYSRIHNKGGVANLYIEGDGPYMATPELWSFNPTPTDPIGLHLATHDKAQNVIYIARPCQYTGTSGCDEKYWKEARFSQDVITAYSKALNKFKNRYGISGFNVIGYEGGAAIASLLASQRNDIRSLRSVAGLLDHDAYTSHTNAAPLSKSLNARDVAASTVNIPQIHIIGGQDEELPPAVLHSFLQKMPPTTCVQTLMIQEASHDEGWVDKWPELLKIPLDCNQADITKNTMEPMRTIPPKTAPNSMSGTTITREIPLKP